MAKENVVEIKQVYKKFDDKMAVNGISFEVYKGECFGLLGPNGAGKSTLMRMMYGSSLLTEGELYVLGLNVKKNITEIKSRIGVVPQEDSLDTDFSVYENLELFCRYHGILKSQIPEKIQTLLRLVKLEDYAYKPVETLSGGLKRRLAIARGLVNNPDVLFLDEPTTGLDPQARLWVWDFFEKLKASHSTLILTTHYMEEAEKVCDRIAIVDHGRVLAIGETKNLIKENIGHEVVEFYSSDADLNYYLNRLKEKKYSYMVIGSMVSVLIKEHQNGRDVFDLISSDKITVRKPTLNDVFLKLAGHELRDET